MHVARGEVRDDQKHMSRWDFVERALPYFDMAIEALENLDRGNRVIKRCASYLSQLTLLPLTDGEIHTYLGAPSITTLANLSLDIGQADESMALPDGQQSHRGSQARSAQEQPRLPGPGAAQRQVPMEIDLNEFMLDTDFDFLARHFDIGALYGSGV